MSERSGDQIGILDRYRYRSGQERTPRVAGKREHLAGQVGHIRKRRVSMQGKQHRARQPVFGSLHFGRPCQTQNHIPVGQLQSRGALWRVYSLLSLRLEVYSTLLSSIEKQIRMLRAELKKSVFDFVVPQLRH